MSKPQLSEWDKLEECWRLREREIAHERANVWWTQVLDDLEAAAPCDYVAALVADVTAGTYLLRDQEYIVDEFATTTDVEPDDDLLLEDMAEVPEPDLVPEVVQVA